MPPSIHVRPRVERILDDPGQVRLRRHTPFQLQLTTLELVDGHLDPFLVKPSEHLLPNPKLAELSEHQGHRIPNPRVWMFDRVTISITVIARRQATAQLSASGFRFFSLLHSHPEHPELHDTECALDTKNQLIIHRGDVVNVLLVPDECRAGLTNFEQTAPVLICAREPRDLSSQNDPDPAPKRHLRSTD